MSGPIGVSPNGSKGIDISKLTREQQELIAKRKLDADGDGILTKGEAVKGSQPDKMGRDRYASDGERQMIKNLVGDGFGI